MNYAQPYIDLITALLNCGISAHKLAAGGGFPRDLYHGAKPNDLDLILVGGLPDIIGRLGFANCLPGDWVITDWHTQDAEYEGATEDFDSRLEQVVQLRYIGSDPDCFRDKFGHVDVDILVATSSYTSVNQHITDNDFNLNHYRIDSLGFLTGQAPYYVGASPEQVLVQCRTAKVTPKRHNRMVDLAKSYGWLVNIPYKG